MKQQPSLHQQWWFLPPTRIATRPTLLPPWTQHDKNNHTTYNNIISTPNLKIPSPSQTEVSEDIQTAQQNDIIKEETTIKNNYPIEAEIIAIGDENLENTLNGEEFMVT